MMYYTGQNMAPCIKPEMISCPGQSTVSGWLPMKCYHVLSLYCHNVVTFDPAVTGYRSSLDSVNVNQTPICHKRPQLTWPTTLMKVEDGVSSMLRLGWTNDSNKLNAYYGWLYPLTKHAQYFMCWTLNKIKPWVSGSCIFFDAKPWSPH